MEIKKYMNNFKIMIRAFWNILIGILFIVIVYGITIFIINNYLYNIVEESNLSGTFIGITFTIMGLSITVRNILIGKESTYFSNFSMKILIENSIQDVYNFLWYVIICSPFLSIIFSTIFKKPYIGIIAILSGTCMILYFSIALSYLTKQKLNIIVVNLLLKNIITDFKIKNENVEDKMEIEFDRNEEDNDSIFNQKVYRKELFSKLFFNEKGLLTEDCVNVYFLFIKELNKIINYKIYDTNHSNKLVNFCTRNFLTSKIVKENLNLLENLYLNALYNDYKEKRTNGLYIYLCEQSIQFNFDAFKYMLNHNNEDEEYLNDIIYETLVLNYIEYKKDTEFWGTYDYREKMYICQIFGVLYACFIDWNFDLVESILNQYILYISKCDFFDDTNTNIYALIYIVITYIFSKKEKISFTQNIKLCEYQQRCRGHILNKNIVKVQALLPKEYQEVLRRKVYE